MAGRGSGICKLECASSASCDLPLEESWLGLLGKKVEDILDARRESRCLVERLPSPSVVWSLLGMDDKGEILPEVLRGVPSFRLVVEISLCGERRSLYVLELLLEALVNEGLCEGNWRLTDELSLAVLRELSFGLAPCAYEETLS